VRGLRCMCCMRRMRRVQAVVKVVFKRWPSCGVHGKRGARAYSRGLGAEPSVGSRGKTPGQEVGAKPPESDAF